MLTGTVGNGYLCVGGWRTDGTDLSFKHLHEEYEQRVKRWTCLVPAVSRD